MALRKSVESSFASFAVAVKVIVPPRKEPIEELLSSDRDQDKVVSEDGFALQQCGDSLDSPSDVLPPPFLPGSKNSSFLIPFRSDYGI